MVHQAEAERRVRVGQSEVDQNAVEQSAHQVELDEALLCEFFLLPARSGPTDLAPLSDWAVQHNRDLVEEFGKRHGVKSTAGREDGQRQHRREARCASLRTAKEVRRGEAARGEATRREARRRGARRGEARRGDAARGEASRRTSLPIVNVAACVGSVLQNGEGDTRFRGECRAWATCRRVA